MKDKKHKRVVVKMPTGGGKTLCAAKIIAGALDKGSSVIFCVPFLSLIDQTVTAFEAEGIRDIGVMQANHPRTNSLAKVQVASVQTLAKRQVPQAALVIVDECHLKAEVVDRLMDERPDVHFVGLSATPWAKGMGLRWQDVVIPCTIGSLIDAGYLSQFSVYAPDVPDLSRVKVRAGEYAEDGLAEVMGDAKLVGSVVQTWLAKGEDRPTLVFGVNCEHAKALLAQFENAGVSAAYVDAYTDAVMRGRINRRFRAGEIRVICSVRTMIAGVDLPVSCICDCAPTRSESLHVQKIGRGLRVNPGTETLIVLDHAGNSLRLGLVTEIEHTTLDKTKPGQKQAASPKAPETLPKPCGGCEVLFTGRVCPNCGAERKAAHGVQTVDGELVEITGRKPKVSAETKRVRLAGLLWIAEARGYKRGWVARQYQSWMGVWPASYPPPAPPTQEVQNWVKSRQIAWAKSKARAA